MGLLPWSRCLTMPNFVHIGLAGSKRQAKTWFQRKIRLIYTKTGDNGSTSLADGTRVSKHALRIEIIQGDKIQPSDAKEFHEVGFKDGQKIITSKEKLMIIGRKCDNEENEQVIYLWSK